MNLTTDLYQVQQTGWPQRGHHILAQFDDQTIVIKPNFLWMMYRCGWATKEAQEVVLAIRMLRSGFEAVFRDAVHSTFVPDVYGDEATWNRALARSGVRLQWIRTMTPAANGSNVGPSNWA